MSAETSGPTAEPAESEESAPAETVLPPGATEGLDDLNGDGEPDPTCGEQDYGAGLVVRILCHYADYAAAPTEDTALVPNSLLGFPNAEVDLTSISGSAVQGRTANGDRLVVLFINSDTLFDVGSSSLSEPARANFDAIADLIRNNWAGAPIQVRGHTDATGSTTANQTLSEQRAATSADYLATRGIDRSCSARWASARRSPSSSRPTPAAPSTRPGSSTTGASSS